LPGPKRKRPRGVVDTSVLVAGIAGLKSPQIAPKNPSANFLRNWIEGDTFVWLVSDEILLEYKRVLGSLGVRRPLIGKIVNLLPGRGGTCSCRCSAKHLSRSRRRSLLRVRRNWPSSIHCDTESEGFSASAPIISGDQARRKHSNNRPPTATTYFTVEPTIVSGKQKQRIDGSASCNSESLRPLPN
jgi:hypothetical protein